MKVLFLSLIHIFSIIYIYIVNAFYTFSKNILYVAACYNLWCIDPVFWMLFWNYELHFWCYIMVSVCKFQIVLK